MNRIWYLSPSNQHVNIGVNNYGSEKKQMNLLVDAIIPHLDRAGVSFHRADPDLSIQSRAKESNEMGSCFHLAFHSNAGGKGKARGPVAYYYSNAGKKVGEQLVCSILELGSENNRAENIRQNKNLYELKRTTAPACLLEVDFHDSPSGVEFLINRRGEIAEAIAKVIIAADGKEFIPITTGECVDEAIKLGLFSENTRWKEPVTREEAATLLVRLWRKLDGR